MKSYKYKINKDKNSSDSTRATPRKAFNSSERLKAKKEILRDIEELPQFSYMEMREIRFNLDEEAHCLCRSRNIHQQALASILLSLEVITLIQYYHLSDGTCNCPDFFAMTDEELLKRAGYLSVKF